MTTEEKAKAYDDIINRVTELYETGTTLTMEQMKYLFPELHKSDDKRIINQLITLINSTGEVIPIPNNKEELLGYLEMQKEQPISAVEVLARAGLKPYKDGNQWCILVGDNIQEGICGFGDTIDEALYQFLMEVLEKQKEHKPNIEFIQRSWYMEGYQDRKYGKEPMWLITTGEDWPKYELNPKYGKKLAEEQKPVEDVVKDITKNKESAIKFLKLAGIMDDNGELAEMYRSEQKPMDYDHEMWKNCEANFEGGKKEVIEHPEKYGLQKEQKSVISEEAIRDGIVHFGITQYQIDNWLKKYINIVEQKPVEINEYEIIKKHITEDFLSSDVNKRLKECGWYVTDEKPAEWNEDDKEMIDSAIKFVEHCAFSTIGKGKNNVLAWLKSLPERFNLQPKQEWSEKDEVMLNRVLESYKALDAYIEDNTDISKEDKIYNKKLGKEETVWLQNRFKFLRPQPHKWYIKKGHWYMCIVDKPEYGWTKGKVYQSPADNRIETDYKGDLTNWPASEPWFRPATREEIPDFKPHWKPSEKQMEALLWCTVHLLIGEDRHMLEELYEQLKKLM